MMRLDRFLAETTALTRSQAVRAVRDGQVSLNGSVVRQPERKLDERLDRVCLAGVSCRWQERRVYMLDKPLGVITASRDTKQQTVLDLFPAEVRKKGIFPVGRLDKDTSGLLLLTDDGELAHRLLSPKSGIDKVYEATVDGRLEEEDIRCFAEGLLLADGIRCLPAGLRILGETRCLVTVREGKYHQVRRMLAAVGKPVITLRRLSVGPLKMDDELGSGGYRELTDEELCILFNAIGLGK